MEKPHFVCPSSADGHVHCFHFLVTVNSAAMNVPVQLSRKQVFSSFGSGVAGLHGNSVELSEQLPNCFLQ